jgi:M6 family metalloprotease-like protein
VLQGRFHVPILLGLFGDSPPGGPFSPATVEEAYFGAGPGTISAYYREVSGGRLDLRADVHGWLRADLRRTGDWVANGNSGLGFGGRVGTFIRDLLKASDGIDWALFDNDGPDGVPNSGDDDGFVDAVAVLHPDQGGECGGPGSGDRIWSHRWSLSAASGRADGYWTTEVPAAGGGFIKVDDYLIQPARSCFSGLAEIGVFTHELGHAFGLPDLYDTDPGNGRHQGVGTWDLMATGSWGCDDRSPERPCHMGAWSKMMLGWVDVVDVPAGTPRTTVALPPVASSGTVYRVWSDDGSGEYVLLENRQRMGFDASLHEEGLLVWQVDPERVAAFWGINEVNGAPDRGVWLRQADGLDELGREGRGRGDAGDPFPLVTPEATNRVFHASSTPASTSRFGTGTGVTLLDIRRTGDHVAFDLLNRRVPVTVRSEEEGRTGDLFAVNGRTVSGASHSFRSAPFERNEIEAAGGEPVEPGVRRPFQAWLDDPDAPRARTVETPLEGLTLVARYGGEEVQLSVESSGGVEGVEPGEFASIPFAPELWFARGTEVSVEARARQGFRFVGWSGALAGRPNPARVVLDGPVRAGADFELTYAARAASATLRAAREEEVALVVENGTAPVTWTLLDGSLPDGLRLDPAGRISGAALETGTFPLEMEARDALGLAATAPVTLVVEDPRLGMDALAAPFLFQASPTLTAAEARFLDRRGNANGTYDLGDFRSWVLAHPDLPASMPAAAAAPVTLTVRGVPGGSSP